MAGRAKTTLQLEFHPVRSLALGDRSRYTAGHLEVDAAELATICRADERLADVRLATASPGDRTRVIHVLDVMAPAPSFPGLTDPVAGAGSGTRPRLEGMAITVACEVAGLEYGHSIKEAILDLSGPGARFTPLSRLHHLVVEPVLRPGLGLAEGCAAAREAGLRACRYLAGLPLGAASARTETLTLGPADPALPKILYIACLSQEGPIHGVYLYGERQGDNPVWLHPTEWLDGALVNGSYHIAACRSCTYWYQNNPVIHALLRRHGTDLSFLGTVAVRASIVGERMKERIAWMTARLARDLGADAAILTLAGGGHGYADLHMRARTCEELGVRAVLVQAELGDDEGADLPLLSFTPESDAIVSTGNQDEVVALPPMERVLGGDAWYAGDTYEPTIPVRPNEAFQTALRRVLCATEQTGSGDGRALPF